MKIKHGGEDSGRIDLDFSVNLNPLGIPREVREAAAAADFESYPDTSCKKLRAAISEFEGISAEKIVCGNGAADLIYRIVGAVKPQRALIAEPTFAEYEKALSEADCAIERHFLSENDGFAFKRDFRGKINEKTDIVFLCNPNNPTGKTIKFIDEIASECKKTGTILAVDECFIDFVKNPGKCSVKPFLNEKAVIIKAFTKSFSMAGLRLGYALFGDKELARKVGEYGQPWSVSSAAQAAGIAALEIPDHLVRARELIEEERGFLTSELTKLGIKVFPSETNFMLLKSGFPLKEMLLKRFISIRSCENFNGLGNEYFRIAVRTHKENTALIGALKELL